MRLGKLVGTFGGQVEAVLRIYQESILDRQYQLARIADSANELYVSACVLRRLDHTVGLRTARRSAANWSSQTGRYYLTTAARRIHRNLDDLWVNDDAETTSLADAMHSAYGQASSGDRPHGKQFAGSASD